ncbi:uncharacterized protein LOC118771618 isoform X2 [Megalops cyprinoides]|uniref:uncharacterized protein LOC118771618 isoform X2 n=1 Tax=Megalops cyprinoides TaxID=118141 RepID=UPI0018650453|nr:uncharacterized protein LOC118771618 isoform X2 [Megalops cyprinoides]
MFESALGTWLLAILLATVEWAGGEETATKTSAPCVDRVQWTNLVKNLGEGITSHDQNILVRMSVFVKIKEEPAYGCVLQKIFEFYDHVLQRSGENYTDVRHFARRLKKCLLSVPCPKVCRRLYKKAKSTPMNETSESESLEPKKVAILQIQKLQQAREQLDDVKTLEKAIVELKDLDFYLPESKEEEATGTKCLKKQNRKSKPKKQASLKRQRCS